MKPELRRHRGHPPAASPGVAGGWSDRTPGQVFDEWLVTLVQAGEREALERLAGRWRPRHYLHACRLLRRSEAANDAVQEAWVGIVRGIPGLIEPARFPAWSYAIVTRRCRDHQRREGRSPVMVEEEPEPPDPITPNPDLAHDLTQAIADLPADQGAALALFYLDGLTVREIAQALRTPVGTVKTRLFHARRSLRRYFEGDT